MKFRDLQHVFDTALEGIRKQGRKSLRGTGYLDQSCKYDGEEGDACALGQLTDDVEQRQQWDKERYMATDISKLLAFERPVDRSKLEGILSWVQVAHDRAANGADFLPDFEQKMALVASQYGLQYKPPTGGEKAQEAEPC